ncbi:MAG: hypothetical protein ACI9K2_005865, partial [Myxococcota bacterium]
RGVLRVDDRSSWVSGGVELRFGDVGDPYAQLFVFAGDRALVRYEAEAIGRVHTRPPAMTTPRRAAAGGRR